jgi:hypothetical protein
VLLCLTWGLIIRNTVVQIMAILASNGLPMVFLLTPFATNPNAKK